MTPPRADGGGRDVARVPLEDGPARARLRDLWPWLLAPPVLVAGAVLWLWLAAEGGFDEAGRYTIR